jgi:hypothetical protein
MLVSCYATCFLMDRGITRGTRRIALWVSPFLARIMHHGAHFSTSAAKARTVDPTR